MEEEEKNNYKIKNIEKDEGVTKNKIKTNESISVLGYIGYQILFAIPCLGIIVALYYGFYKTKNINLKNFARASFYLTILIYMLMFIFVLVVGKWAMSTLSY